MVDDIRPLTNTDKHWACNLLAKCFEENLSANYVIKGCRNKESAINGLMEYSFELCLSNGLAFGITNKAVLLAKHKNSQASFIQNLKLLLTVIPWSNIPNLLRREHYLKEQMPAYSFIHVWYIGVSSEQQGKGYGTSIMNFICGKAAEAKLPIILETSNPRNIIFYNDLGFKCYHESPIEHFGFPLYFFSKPYP